LKPGFFAKGRILTRLDEKVLAVPEETISMLAGVSSVFVIENGVAKQLTVQLGEHQGNEVEIVSGLKGDEVLAASNLNQLVSGIRVVSGDEETSFGDRTGRGGAR
jgi:membrane fusion protein (multidrug efflux system)